MLNLAIHNVERVTLDPVRELPGENGQFATRSITVLYSDRYGDLHTQQVNLYADEAASLSVLMPEEVTA